MRYRTMLGIAVKKRTSEDVSVNTFGRKSSSVCQSKRMRVANDRTKGDTFGRFDFYNHLGSSVEPSEMQVSLPRTGSLPCQRLCP